MDIRSFLNISNISTAMRLLKLSSKSRLHFSTGREKRTLPGSQFLISATKVKSTKLSSTHHDINGRNLRENSGMHTVINKHMQKQRGTLHPPGAHSIPRGHTPSPGGPPQPQGAHPSPRHKPHTPLYLVYMIGSQSYLSEGEVYCVRCSPGE